MLDEQVRTAEEAYERAFRAYNDARDALSVSYDDLTTYRRAFEAATRGTDEPYHPPPLPHPFSEQPAANGAAKEPEPMSAAQPRTRRVLKPTKKGVILDALGTANGKGMKVIDVFRAIPADAPLKITKADINRALPRLVDEEKAWRDGAGYYHPGQPSDLDRLFNDPFAVKAVEEE